MNIFRLPEGVSPYWVADNGDRFAVFPVASRMRFVDCYKCMINNVPFLNMPHPYRDNGRGGGYAIGRVTEHGNLIRVLKKSDAEIVFFEMLKKKPGFVVLGL